MLVAICIWLLYQVKRSHDKNKACEDGSSKILAKMLNGHEIIKLGRRDLHPGMDAPFEIEKHGEKKEESDNEDGRGGGDDDIDEHDQEEESEDVEDLIDEEDSERDDIEEQESEDKGIDFEDVKSSNDQADSEGKSNRQKAREEHNKDDASSAVMQNVQTISGSLRKVQEEVEIADKDEVEKEIETYHTQDFIVGMKDSKTKVHRSLTAKSFGADNAEDVKEMDSEFDSFHSDKLMYSSSLVKAESNEQKKVKDDSTMLLFKDPFLNETNKLPELISNISSNGSLSYLGTVLAKMNENPEATSVQTNSNLTLSAFEDSNAMEKGMALNGSESTVPEGILQFGATAKIEKSSARETTNENAFASGESKTNDELHSGEESSKILASNENLVAVEESSGSSDSSFYQEDREGHSFMSSL